MKYRFPLAVPQGERLYITQGYKSAEMAEFYQKNGLQWFIHPAIDVTRESQVKTYGTPFVCPFPYATLDRIVQLADAENGKSGHIQIKATLPNGDSIILGCGHLSDTEIRDVYKEGDIIGYLGNYGLVSPKPTIAAPFQGSHAHIETYVNGQVVNPLDYFDISNPFRAPDTGNERDVFAIRWAIREIKEAIKRISNR